MTSQRMIELLKDELTEFKDEFDTSDSEWTQILFKRRVSTLINKGVIKTRQLPRKLRLTEVLELIGLDEEPGIIGRAQEVDKVLQSYGDEPTENEMEEGLQSLESVIESINKALEKRRT